MSAGMEIYTYVRMLYNRMDDLKQNYEDIIGELERVYETYRDDIKKDAEVDEWFKDVIAMLKQAKPDIDDAWSALGGLEDIVSEIAE